MGGGFTKNLYSGWITVSFWNIERKLRKLQVPPKPSERQLARKAVMFIVTTTRTSNGMYMSKIR